MGKELGELILRIIILVVLLAFVFGIISIFTQPKPIDASVQDFQRIVTEIRDIEPGERIVVPVLSNKKFIIKSTKIAKDLNLNCDGTRGNWCACLAEEGGSGYDECDDLSIRTCTELSLPNVDVIYIDDCGVSLVPKAPEQEGGVLIEMSDDQRLSVSPNT